MEATTTIKRRSNNNAIISLVVFLLIAAGMFVSIFGLYSFKKELQRKDEILEEKDLAIAKKDSLMIKQDNLLESKSSILHSLQQEINEYGDSSITVQVKFQKVEGVYNSDGLQMWDWTIWLKSSVHRLNQINKVYYKAKCENMTHPYRASVERSNSYLVHYRHFDCLESVRITIQYEDGKEEAIYLNSCERFQGFKVEQFQSTKKESSLSLR